VIGPLKYGWLFLIALVCSTVNAPADVVHLHPSADATLHEVAPDNSSGGAGFFLAGTTQNRTRNRALLQFDIASALPAGAIITEASLEVEVERRPRDGFEASIFGLHRVLVSWGEGTTVPIDNPGGYGAPAAPNDATWMHRFASTSLTWGEPGGLAGVDFDPGLVSSTTIYDVGSYGFEGTFAMLDNLQSWLDHPQGNFGWILMSQAEDTPFTGRRFFSREHESEGPTLRIEFTVVPEPAVILPGLLGTFLALEFRRRRRAARS
jgi:hypothetical protein